MAAVSEFEEQTVFTDTPVSENSERRHSLRDETLMKGRFERFDLDINGLG